MFVVNGRVTSQAFKPTPKDEGKLSVEDAEKTDAFKSFQNYTTALKLASAGVMGVTEGECQACELNVVCDGVPTPEHCYIDFTALTEGESKKKAKLLAAAATARDWLLKAA